MTKQEEMQQAWEEWHKDLPKGVVPDKPNASFIKAFDVGYALGRRRDIKFLQDETVEPIKDGAAGGYILPKECSKEFVDELKKALPPSTVVQVLN